MTAAMRLYETVNALEIVSDFLWESGGEITPEIQELLDQAEGDFAEKVERVALFIRGQSLQAKLIKEEEQRLAERRTRYEKSVESLKNYLLYEMNRAGRQKVEGKLINVRVQKNPPSVIGEIDPTTLGVEWTEIVRVVPEQKILDRRAVVDRFKRGDSIPEGLTIEQKESVRLA